MQFAFKHLSIYFINGGVYLKRQRLLLVFMIIITIITGCRNDPAEPSVVEKTKDTKEAPMLAELVTAGSLPALADRMPAKADIMIEPVFEEIGQYGGEWKRRGPASTTSGMLESRRKRPCSVSPKTARIWNQTLPKDMTSMRIQPNIRYT
jgi:hypothetical protein